MLVASLHVPKKEKDDVMAIVAQLRSDIVKKWARRVADRARGFRSARAGVARARVTA
jgi:hypothetical protein